MTAGKIFQKACGYLSQTVAETEELASFAVLWLDTLAAEALPYENALRRYYRDESKPPLAAAPRVQSLTDEIPYREEICRVALPYGLASCLFSDEENEYRAQDFRARYISALNESQKLADEGVVDVYA